MEYSRNRGKCGKSTKHRRIVRLRFLASDPRCSYCGKELSDKTATLDHKLPLSRGGSNGRANLVLSCQKCNSHKGSMTMSEFTGSEKEPTGLRYFPFSELKKPKREKRKP